MKKISFILACAALGACSSEDNLPSGENFIRLTSEITPMTRGSSLNQQSIQIESGQNVSVTITGARSEHNNVAWTVGNNGEMTNTGETLYWGDGYITITAYHPCNADWTESRESPTFTVNVDQTGNGYLNSDLLWTTKTASKSAEAVPLTFTHKLAKINVTLTSEEIADLSNATISICGTNIETVFNPKSGDISSSVNSTIRTIKAGVNTSTASAIIVPQKITAGTKFIQVELNSKYYYYVLPADKTFETGNSYSYTLKLKSTVELQCVSNAITNWNDEAIVGDGEEATDADITTVTLTDAGTLQSTLGNQMLNITQLKIVGPLNGTDIKCLRHMVGCSDFSESLKGQLTNLDMSEATIVEGGDSYKDSYNTANNEIGADMFRMSNLQKIILPNNVTTIGNSAFFECYDLTSVTIGNNVTTIGNYAFWYCIYNHRTTKTNQKCPSVNL